MKQDERIARIIAHLPELTALFHGLFRIGTSSTRESKTNVIRYNILKRLQQHGTQVLTDISSSVQYKKNTLSQLLDRMTRGGLVRRQAHPRDRRKINFTITPAGLGAVREFEKKFISNVQDFLSHIPEKERDAFLQCLGSLISVSTGCAGSRNGRERSPS